MEEVLGNLLWSRKYIPHGHCYLWQPPLVGLHLVSDILIAIAYFSIPAILVFFVYKRSHIPFLNVFILFSAFIVFCGAGHLLNIWTLWYPTYWLSGIEKAITALISCYTAFYLGKLLPQFLALQTPEKLEAINQELQKEIAERQQTEQTLQTIVAGTASVTGQAFFPVLVEHLAKALQVQYVFVAELVNQEPKALKTIAFWAIDQLQENFAYTLVGTPCGRVVEQAALFYCPDDLKQRFPGAIELPALDADCYLGVPLLDDNQQVIGVLCVTSDRPLIYTENAKTIITVFAARAAVELQRQRAESALCRSYDELDLRVQARTAELLAANTALQQQAMREQLVSAITQRIHQSLKLENILDVTVAEIQQLLQVDRAIIYRLEPDGSGRVVVEAVEADWKLTTGIVIHDCHFAEVYAHLYRQGRVQAVEDIYTAGLTPCHVELLETFQVRANLAVPIVTEEKLWGLLVVQQCASTRQWRPIEIDLLKQLATQAAIAIQQSELYEQAQAEIAQRQQTEIVLKHQAAREQLVNEIAQRIRQSLNLQDTLGTTVAEVRQVLQADRVLLYQVHPDGTGSVITESVAEGCSMILNQPLPEEIFPQECYERYRQGRVRQVIDVETDEMSPCLAETLRQIGVKSKLVVPILQGENLWGLLIAHQCHTSRHWHNVEVTLLKQLAIHVAIAIQQSGLFEQVQQLNTVLEAQVEERTAQLQQALDLEASLKRITDKVRDSLDESQILQTAVAELTQLLGVDSCDTALYDLEQETSTIRYEHTSSLSPAQNKVVQMSEFNDIYVQLLQGQYLQFCKLYPDSIRPERRRQNTILACPIFDEQGIIGDLWLSRQGNRSFNELEIRLVQQVANQCAIALRQARLYQASQAQVEELEKLNHLKDDFLSTVSHELRTPMSNIKMATQMLEIVLQQTDLLDSENTIHRYFKILRDECQRETQLINDLLDLARLDSETEPLILTTIPLNDWIHSLTEPFTERVNSQGQHLKINLAPQLPLLTTDLSYLGRAITELLNNACKYTPAGETITITVKATAEIWQLCISNSGVTIAETELDRIFDKFYRIPNNDPWRYGGTGLGLALVKKLIERLGGTIQVKSSATQTTFIMKLPLNPVTALALN